MVLSVLRSLTLVLFVLGPTSALAQEFDPGWYVVEPDAEFLVLQRSAQDPEGGELWIAAGEALVCHDESGGTAFCFEQHGRMSAVRGGLTSAARGGKPGSVVEDIALLDRTLTRGMVLWVVSIDASSGTATVQLDGGRVERVPASSVTILSNAYRNALAGQAFTPVRR